MEIIADNVNSLFLTALENLKNADEVNSRNGLTKEILNMNLVLTDPCKNVLTMKKRYNNFPASVYETFWVFSGYSYLSELSNMIPNVLNYSDDNNFSDTKTLLPTWRGAYGPRLSHQIQNVVLSLFRDPDSRQAIIVIGNENDYNPGMVTKDRPCTLFVQFMIRNNKLDTFVRMRSNDAIWGCFNINIFEFTMLQQIIAKILGYEVGHYYHNSTSFHIYEKHFHRMDNILKNNRSYSYPKTLASSSGIYHGMQLKNTETFPKRDNKTGKDIIFSMYRFFDIAAKIANPAMLLDEPVYKILLKDNVNDCKQKAEFVIMNIQNNLINHEGYELYKLLLPYAYSSVLSYLYSSYKNTYISHRSVISKKDLFLLFKHIILLSVKYNPFVAIANMETFTRIICNKNNIKLMNQTETRQFIDLLMIASNSISREFISELVKATEQKISFSDKGLANTASFITEEINSKG